MDTWTVVVPESSAARNLSPRDRSRQLHKPESYRGQTHYQPDQQPRIPQRIRADPSDNEHWADMHTPPANKRIPTQMPSNRVEL
jgi:hypothetical protein